MAFDWFRRTFLNRSDNGAEQPAEPPAETLSDAGDATTADVDQAELDPADLESDLADAESEIVPDVELDVESDVELDVEIDVEPDVDADTETEVQPDAETEVQPDAETEVQPDEEPDVESDVETDAVAVEAESTLPAIAEASVSVLAYAQSAYENIQRQPQAQSTQPGPEEATSSVEADEDETGVPAFDEGFIWSAEVLARQGRKADEISVEEINWLQKLRRGLAKTRLNVTNRLKAIVGQGPLNQDAVQEIETLLLQADVGVDATDYIIEQLQIKLRSEVLPPDAAIAYLKELLCAMLDQVQSERFMPRKGVLNIWLMTGVNGAGKTTTIGKIAHVAQKSGYQCMIAAADTFRAAAVEQVRVWGQRSNVEVICNPGKNTDPAAVVFDGIIAAQSRGIDLLLVDTAGRLQNKKNLMDELTKIRRIVDKKAPDAQVESFLVLDATLGQNGLQQAKVFSESAQLTGVVLTKLDGTAKGGVALGIVRQLGLPIRFVGAGEGIEDLRPFSSYEFVEALLSN